MRPWRKLSRPTPRVNWRGEIQRSMSNSESYASVWDAIADTPEEAANLSARAELIGRSRRG